MLAITLYGYRRLRKVARGTTCWERECLPLYVYMQGSCVHTKSTSTGCLCRAVARFVYLPPSGTVSRLSLPRFQPQSVHRVDLPSVSYLGTADHVSSPTQQAAVRCWALRDICFSVRSPYQGCGALSTIHCLLDGKNSQSGCIPCLGIWLLAYQRNTSSLFRCKCPSIPRILSTSALQQSAVGSAYGFKRTSVVGLPHTNTHR